VSDAPKFFATLDEWRGWLKTNHKKRDVLWVGFYKRASGEPSITWPEAVDGALCFGWIDGVRKSIDARSYMIRFTPRRSGSNWSAVNVKRVAELERRGWMSPAGRAAFAARSDEKTYSYEQRNQSLRSP
jgi:uncharacterized protein YdeI (YjbR/CyaY-like superfamily)